MVVAVNRSGRFGSVILEVLEAQGVPADRPDRRGPAESRVDSEEPGSSISNHLDSAEPVSQARIPVDSGDSVSDRLGLEALADAEQITATIHGITRAKVTLCGARS